MITRPRLLLLLLFALGLSGCRTVAPEPEHDLWSAITPLCGKAFEGQMVEGTEPSDAAIGTQRLVMHVRSCTADEIRIPFHVGDDRSRTWVISRTATGVRLKHDHRHADGSPDTVTQYGGDSIGPVSAALVEFPADAHTAALLPAAATNVWSFVVTPATFRYALRRSNRRFAVEFDLTRAVEAPPAPW